MNTEYCHMGVSLHQKMKFFIKDFFNKSEQVHICSHLQKKSLRENYIFHALYIPLVSL